MAGINPETGLFDPYYYAPNTSGVSGAVTNSGETFTNQPNTFVNNGGGQTQPVNPTYIVGGQVVDPNPTPTPTPEPTAVPEVETGGGGGGGAPAKTAEDAYWEWRRAQEEADRDSRLREERETASAFLKNVLTTYGLDSLAGSIDDLISQWGTNTDVIALKLKDTSEYKTRFKGLLGLQQRGVTDVRNEAEYLQLETSYRQVFREAGLTSFLGESGTQAEYDKIADIVGKYSLSVNEVSDRVADAQRVAANTPQEVRDAFREFYGVDSTQLVEYALDPVGTAERINRQANAAIAAGLARQQGLNVGKGVAGQIAGMAGNQDLNQAQLGQTLVDTVGVRDATVRLAAIENSTLSDDETLQSTMNLDADAVKKVTGLQSRERARFSGTSAAGGNALTRSRNI